MFAAYRCTTSLNLRWYLVPPDALNDLVFRESALMTMRHCPAPNLGKDYSVTFLDTEAGLINGRFIIRITPSENLFEVVYQVGSGWQATRCTQAALNGFFWSARPEKAETAA